MALTTEYLNEIESKKELRDVYLKFTFYAYSDQKLETSETFKNSIITNIAVLQGSNGKLYIRSIYNIVKDLRKDEIFAILNKYANEKLLKYIDEINFVNLKVLTALILWLKTYTEYNVKEIGIAEDLETNQPMFICIYIENCGWEEWKKVSKNIKKQLIDEGFDEIAGRVALICKEALQIPRN